MVFSNQKIINLDDLLLKQRLNEIMQKRKITQKELAGLLDVRPLTVFRWLHQPINEFKKENLIMLSRVLDVPIEYFIDVNFKFKTLSETIQNDTDKFFKDYDTFIRFLNEMHVSIDLVPRSASSCNMYVTYDVLIESTDINRKYTLEDFEKFKKKIELKVIDYLL